MAEQSQLIAYEKAKSILGAELGVDMLGWDFIKMMDELKRAIAETCPEKEDHPVRRFARRHLGLSGESYKKLHTWIRGQKPMSVEEVVLVLRALQTLQVSKPEASEARSFGRKFVSFVIVTLNSFSGMIAEAGIKPAEVSEGDKLEVRRILQEICSRLGIPVVFPEDTTGYKPVTRSQLAKFNLGDMKGKQ